MLLRISDIANDSGSGFSRVVEPEPPRELDIERFLFSLQDEAGNDALEEVRQSVLREDLLLLSRQGRTKQGKRWDLLAIDRKGRGVIIEIKRHAAQAGVEMQALQYLAGLAGLRGEEFLSCALDGESDPGYRRQQIEEFMDGATIEDLNRSSRIILLARGFDQTLFAMGEWLADQGVPFKCIEYRTYEIEKHRFLGFSVRFDRSNEYLHRMEAGRGHRRERPTAHWWITDRPSTDSGMTLGDWWRGHIEGGFIAVGFEGLPGDRGEAIMRKFEPGDMVFAYMPGVGAVGYGVVGKGAYKLLDESQRNSSDRLKGQNPHRVRNRPVTTPCSEAWGLIAVTDPRR